MPNTPSRPATRGSLRELLTLAWPMVVSRSTQSVVGLADALMVAPLGAAALAATTTGAINTFAIVILPMGTVFIVQSFAAQYAGRGDLVSARRFAWYGLVLAAVSQALALVAVPFVPAALGRFGFEPQVLGAMSSYMMIRLCSTGFIVLTEALGNWFGGIGDTRVQMRASVLTMFVNLFLNWVFIYGNLGAPRLGVPGAALASALATVAGAGFMWAAFTARQREIAAGQPLALRLRELVRVVRFGFPNGINWFMEVSAFTLFLNAVVSQLGTVVLASLNVILQINSVSFMPAFGLTSAGAILVGQAIGRSGLAEVPGLVWLTVRVTLTWQGAVGLAYLLFPRVFIAPFATHGADAAQLMEVGALMLALSAAWQLFDAVGLTVGEALRAAGDTAWCMWARLVAAWALFLPASWLLITRFGGGPAMVMVCVIGYLAILAAALLWRFQSGAWRRIALTEPAHELPL